MYIIIFIIIIDLIQLILLQRRVTCDGFSLLFGWSKIISSEFRVNNASRLWFWVSRLTNCCLPIFNGYSLHCFIFFWKAFKVIFIEYCFVYFKCISIFCLLQLPTYSMLLMLSNYLMLLTIEIFSGESHFIVSFYKKILNFIPMTNNYWLTECESLSHETSRIMYNSICKN